MKAFTDLEQSKRLAEILPLESADAYYTVIDQGFFLEVKQGIEPSKEDIPCWSLAVLLDVLPEGVIENYYVPNLQKENGKYSIAYGNEELLCVADNPLDACVAMIENLHELKML